MRRKPCTIGNSRGFIVPKKTKPLKANQEYVIKIVEKEKYVEEEVNEHEVETTNS